MDRISVTGISTFGFHGVLPHERRFGQWFAVDLALDVDRTDVVDRDELATTVDYSALVTAVVDILAGEPVNLIETLAERIADRCLEESRVVGAEVTVHKPQAPVSARVADVAVTVVRRR